MFNPIQIILLILACHIIGTLGQNVQLVAKFGGQQVFRGLIAGFIMGDVKTGLLIGGTFQLMSMGLAAYGGASIPNFNTALWISVPFAIASGTDAPLELAMAVGVPVATLGIQLDVIAKTVNSYWYHRAEKHVEKREYKKLYRDILIGEYGFGRAALGQTLPVIIFLLFGEPIVQLIINYMPVWLTSALGTVSGVLPALGMALLMLYMPVKENFHYLLLGFVLYVFFGQSILAITLVGAVIAIVLFKRMEKASKAAANAYLNVDAGGIGDE